MEYKVGDLVYFNLPNSDLGNHFTVLTNINTSYGFGHSPVNKPHNKPKIMYVNTRDLLYAENKLLRILYDI